MSTIQIYRRRGEFLEIELADFVALLEQSRSSLAAPLSAERMGIVNDLSSRLLADRSIVDRPAMAYFAHWTRRAALRDLARRFEASLPADTLAAPRGIVLHIPPRNVETIFLFSWVLSFLTGNSNVVRLPRQAGGAVMQAVDLLVDRLSAEVCQTQFFIHSPIDLSISSALSSTADARVVWGGDEKIAAFETLPLRNGGKAIWFGDRYSYAVLAGDALKAAGPHEIEALARKLCTDIFTFDQMGCSSPHKLFIVGDPAEHGGIVVTLAGAVRDEASRRGIDIPPSHSVRKITEACALAGSTTGASIPYLSGNLTAVILAQRRTAEDRLGGGYLAVEFVDRLMDLADQVGPKHQTLTHYGFSKEELLDFARRTTLRGLSRIVPIGHALDFDAVWDGYDLPRELTRTVRLY